MITTTTHLIMLAAIFSSPTFSQELDREESLLNKYPGFNYNEDYEKLQRDQENARTKIISTCMADAGFKYIDGEYFEIEVGASDVLTAADAEAIVEQLKLKDELYEKQLPDDRAGYYKALYGEVNMDNPGPNFLDTIESGGAGCFGRAERDVVSVFAISSKLTQEYTDALYSAYKDSNYLESESEWRACIARTGYDFKDPVAFRTAVISGVGIRSAIELSDRVKTELLDISNKCISESNLDTALTNARKMAEERFYSKNRKLLEQSVDRIPALREKVDQILRQ